MATMWFVGSTDAFWEEQLANLTEFRIRMEGRRDRLREDYAIGADATGADAMLAVPLSKMRRRSLKR